MAIENANPIIHAVNGAVGKAWHSTIFHDDDLWLNDLGAAAVSDDSDVDEPIDAEEIFGERRKLLKWILV